VYFHMLLENISVDALCFLKVLSDKCLYRSILTRAHAPRQVICLRFSPDSLKLASGSGDKTVRLWNVATEARLAQPLPLLLALLPLPPLVLLVLWLRLRLLPLLMLLALLPLPLPPLMLLLPLLPLPLLPRLLLPLLLLLLLALLAPMLLMLLLLLLLLPLSDAAPPGGRRRRSRWRATATASPCSRGPPTAGASPRAGEPRRMPSASPDSLRCVSSFRDRSPIKDWRFHTSSLKRVPKTPNAS
jgi:hypothetical protein